MKTFNLRAIASAAAIAILSASAFTSSAFGDQKNQDQKHATELDNETTASIGSIRNCDPKSPKAGIVCRITQGNPDAKFPSAPTGAFGL